MSITTIDEYFKLRMNAQKGEHFMGKDLILVSLDQVL